MDKYEPEGYWKVNVSEVWTDGSEIFILGDPLDEEKCPNENHSHNCDYYGCGSVGPHVLYRGDLHGWLAAEWRAAYNLSEDELKAFVNRKIGLDDVG